jgi:cobalt-zinc-cadmium efflux system outer membrane protein
MRAAIALLVLLVSASAARGQGSGAEREPLTLPTLEQLALANNPTMAGAQAAVEAARGRARQAGAWPNPTLGYTGEELTPRRTDPRGEHGFFVEQTIPLGGKRGLSRSVFERTAESAEAGRDLQRQRIVSSVRRLFYQTLTAERRVEVHERLATLVSDAIGVTAQLFNVGAADRPDFLETEIEAARVQLELNAARNEVFALRQQLAAVAGSPDVASRPLSGSIEQSIPEMDRDSTIRALVEQSPQMRAIRTNVARARALTARARSETSPDLFVRGGAAYNREHGETTGQPIGWEGQAEFGISVPLFNRNQGGVAAARAEESRAEAEVRRLELSLRAAAAAEFATYLTAIRGIELYRTAILPRAEEAYRLYLARYREMGAAYPQVLVAQRTLFEMSREYLEAIDRAWRSALTLQSGLVGDGLASPGGDAGDELTTELNEGREK